MKRIYGEKSASAILLDSIDEIKIVSSWVAAAEKFRYAKTELVSKFSVIVSYYFQCMDVGVIKVRLYK